jgi:hypothetical protein
MAVAHFRLRALPPETGPAALVAPEGASGTEAGRTSDDA